MFRFALWRPGGGGALLALALAGPMAADSVAAPQLVVREPAFPFGAVQDDAPIVHAFELENPGDEPLVIRRVHPGCPDCTRHTLDRNPIPPGESATLVMTLDPTGLADDVEKDLTLDSNAPDTPSLTLWLRGTILPRFHCQPDKGVIEQASTSAVGRAQIAITPLRSLNLPLTEVESDSAYVSGAVVPEADGTYTLQVATRPPLPTGIHHALLRVFSADTNDPACRVKVDVGVWPGFLTVPETLRFKTGTDGQMRILFLRQFPDTPHRILGAETTASNLALEIHSEPAGLNYRVYVHAPRTAETNAGSILIHTDDPDQPTLAVPFSFEH